jgi:GrpB-like predicted nucleotidyltransferase (UPF0157 family)
MSLGLQHGAVALVPHSTEWRSNFEAERQRIKNALGQQALDIQHVGSTALPGILAKPIIDIAVAVRNYEAAFACVDTMASRGYEYRGDGGIPGRRYYFVRGQPSAYHVHVVESGSDDWNAMVAFRDYLLSRPEVAAEYERLKVQLAAAFPNARKTYQEAKAGFIREVIRRACHEQQSH